MTKLLFHFYTINKIYNTKLFEKKLTTCRNRCILGTCSCQSNLLSTALSILCSSARLYCCLVAPRRSSSPNGCWSTSSQSLAAMYRQVRPRHSRYLQWDRLCYMFRNVARNYIICYILMSCKCIWKYRRTHSQSHFSQPHISQIPV